MLDGLRLIILFIPNQLAIFAVHAVTFKDVIPRWDRPIRLVQSYMPVEFLLLREVVVECDKFDP